MSISGRVAGYCSPEEFEQQYVLANADQDPKETSSAHVFCPLSVRVLLASSTFFASSSSAISAQEGGWDFSFLANAAGKRSP